MVHLNMDTGKEEVNTNLKMANTMTVNLRKGYFKEKVNIFGLLQYIMKDNSLEVRKKVLENTFSMRGPTQEILKMI